MSKNDGNIIVEGARIIFRNFAGEAGKFNAPGDRNFCLILDDPGLVEQLMEDGWGVRELQPRDEGDDPQPYLPVKVKYEPFPPKVVLVTSNGMTTLTEATIDVLDTAEIENVDIIVRPYHWDVNGKKGVKAYVKSMYVTIVEDELEKKYHILANQED